MSVVSGFFFGVFCYNHRFLRAALPYLHQGPAQRQLAQCSDPAGLGWKDTPQSNGRTNRVVYRPPGAVVQPMQIFASPQTNP